MISREEILQLRAGREIDILVAEQVMGWHLETGEARLRRLNSYFLSDEKRRWWRKPEGGWYSDPPSYSSDITAAWQVVESLNSRGQVLFLSRSSNESKVAFDEPRATSPEYITERSITEAICKAALIALSQRAAKGNVAAALNLTIPVSEYSLNASAIK